MTDPTTDDRPPGVRVLTDGGEDQTTTKTKTVTADAVVEREVRDDEEREVLRVPISSTRQDRDGDAFSREDLEARAEQIRSDKPMVFDDHGAVSAGLFGGGYSARETIGTQFDAEVEENSEDEHATLYAYINPDHSHPEGERMLKQVRDEMQAIKFSVGFRILKSSEDMPDEEQPDRANEIPGRLFKRTDLMETSRVGIPANPDASAGVTAKDGMDTEDPRVALAAQLLGVDSEQLAAGRGMVAKTDGGPDAGKGSCDVDADCPEDEVCVNGECVPEDSVEDGADDPGGSKAECPECGESVPDDANYCPNCGAEMEDGGDDDDGDDDEDSASADGDMVTREEFDELKAELEAAREALKSGRGDPESANTDTTKDQSPADEDGETNDADDDGETKEVPQTALERAGSK